ncbi:hypothetical protein ACHBGV_00350 [Streptococcus sp. A34]|uniref:hypothetical protein n=1 Tax=Streptococcus TaxID=1301 RepID=UPI0015536DFA|nr:hypothetical protein [Streptococcus suis]NQI34110.1 hypothetical protein [Streptococcus suis]NQL65393.1 hypothetical protein [Streptococcus suis]NQO45376.1 hypothetical protein [Streptococcus suis]NQP18979.1 hypothetical protein [Streptococcus suis]UUM56993.1 hypothetical protein NQZ91_06175 [Streptococcus suis]
MKRLKKILLLIVGLMIAISIYLIATKILSNPTIDINSEADFYIISNNNITGYRFENKEFIPVSTNSIELVKGQINPTVHRAELENRYLVFSEEGPPLGVVGRIISIDFEDGKIRYNKTPEYAYTSSGQYQNLYFTSEANTGETFIASFDSNLNKKNKYIFEEPLLGNDFKADGDYIYFLGTKVHGQGTFPTDLYKLSINNGEIRLESKETLFENSDTTYSFEDTIIKNNSLFAVVNGRRDSPYASWVPIGKILHYDLDSKQSEFIDLPEISPTNIYDLGQDILAIEHERNDSGKVCFSLFNTRDYSTQFVDLSQYGLSSNQAYIKDVKRINSDTILILAGNQLIAYNTDANEAVTSMDSIEENSFHIWSKFR